jgi:hypothetical protein
LLSFGRRYIAERFEETVVVEPGRPFQRGQFDGLTDLPGSAAVDQLSLERAPPASILLV